MDAPRVRAVHCKDTNMANVASAPPGKAKEAVQGKTAPAARVAVAKTSASAQTKTAPPPKPVPAPTPAPAPSAAVDHDERASALAFLATLATEVSKGTVNLPCFPDVVMRIRKA